MKTFFQVIYGGKGGHEKGSCKALVNDNYSFQTPLSPIIVKKNIIVLVS